MNLTKNQKILLAVAIGGGVAWMMRKKSSTSPSSTTTIGGVKEDAENPVTREGKIEYIINNTDSEQAEEQTGFSGDRFQYDPTIGYAIPVGKVREVPASAEITLMKEGNLANEVFFNADGDPTVDAIDTFNGLTDDEVNQLFKLVKKKRSNPQLSMGQIATDQSIDTASSRYALLRSKLQDIKALKKNPNWKKRWSERKSRIMNRVRQNPNKGLLSRLDARLNRIESRVRGRRKGGQGRVKFQDQVTNREGGAIFGGFRRDGRGTNANALLRRNRANG